MSSWRLACLRFEGLARVDGAFLTGRAYADLEGGRS